MKVLVVGGAGYVGGAVTDILSKSDDHSFIVYDNLLYEDSYRKEVKFVFGDVRDYEKLLFHLKYIDAVIWLAAIVGDGACAHNPEIAMAINRDSVKWLSENFQGKIIFMSTCSVYGAHDDLLDEESEVNPLSVYASTKYEAESFLMDRDAIVFRLGTLYGVSDRFARMRMDLVVNTLTYKACVDNKIQIFGGEQYRPLLHVRDTAQAIVKALDSQCQGVFNLAECNMKISDLAKILKSCFYGLEIEKVEIPYEDARNYKVDTSKAKNLLSFDPERDTLDGIFEIQGLIRSGRIKNIHSKQYSNAEFLKELKL